MEVAPVAISGSVELDTCRLIYVCFLFTSRYLVHHTYAASSFTNNKMEDMGDAFHSMNHAERMMKKMEEYVRKRSLCDVVLVAGQRKIPAHRLVLSAASDYFAAMFTNDVQEATLEEIKIKEVDPDALAAIVNFAYTGMKINTSKSMKIVNIKKV